MATYYPPVGFFFSVSFSSDKLKPTDGDSQFQSISGLTVEYEKEALNEGGENRFQHQLPVRTKYSPLVLKRGLQVDTALLDWCINAFQYYEIVPVDLFVDLLDAERQVLKSWFIVNAWPAKWSLSDFNAEENNLAIETLELNYSYFEVY